MLKLSSLSLSLSLSRAHTKWQLKSSRCSGSRSKAPALHSRHSSPAFTIVELLIVIVIIAILAVITIVAYNGIQSRARASAATTALSQAKRKLELYKIDSSTYPTSGNLSAAGITDSDSASFQYTSTTGTDYCLTATNGNVSYYLNTTTATTPTSGGCAGHGQGGVAAITNLAVNPRANTGAGGWSSNNGAVWTCSAGNTVSGHPTGITTATKCALITAVTSSTVLSLYNIDQLGNTATVRTTGVWVWASTTGYKARVGGSSQHVFTTLPATTWVYVQSPGSYSGWSGVDVTTVSGGNASASDYAYATGSISVAGNTNYTFADGSSANWVWNGTTNTSTSIGPPL